MTIRKLMRVSVLVPSVLAGLAKGQTHVGLGAGFGVSEVNASGGSAEGGQIKLASVKLLALSTSEKFGIIVLGELTDREFRVEFDPQGNGPTMSVDHKVQGETIGFGVGPWFQLHDRVGLDVLMQFESFASVSEQLEYRSHSSAEPDSLGPSTNADSEFNGAVVRLSTGIEVDLVDRPSWGLVAGVRGSASLGSWHKSEKVNSWDAYAHIGFMFKFPWRLLRAPEKTMG